MVDEGAEDEGGAPSSVNGYCPTTADPARSGAARGARDPRTVAFAQLRGNDAPCTNAFELPVTANVAGASLGRGATVQPLCGHPRRYTLRFRAATERCGPNA